MPVLAATPSGSLILLSDAHDTRSDNFVYYPENATVDCDICTVANSRRKTLRTEHLRVTTILISRTQHCHHTTQLISCSGRPRKRGGRGGRRSATKLPVCARLILPYIHEPRLSNNLRMEVSLPLEHVLGCDVVDDPKIMISGRNWVHGVIAIVVVLVPVSFGGGSWPYSDMEHTQVDV